MNLSDKYFPTVRPALIMTMAVMFLQQSAAQSYLNINFTNSSNKYSLITEVKSITFDESGGIIIKKTDNTISTETLTQLKSLTLDESSGGGTALPVELVSFTASSASGITKLKWTTATEKNNYGFEIERAFIHGQLKIDNWQSIGFVEGCGNSNSSKEYSYTDNNPSAGKYVYRLKQIDRDGMFGYSQEAEVTVSPVPQSFTLMQNYPNPFNPSTEISYQLPALSRTTLIVYDAIGREAAVLVNEVKEAGYYTATFDASKFASGIYFAKLQSGEKVQMKKMLMLK